MNNNTTTVSFPVVGLLGVAFVILKLCKVISWPWIWVTAPFWGPLALLLAVLIVLGIVYLCKR